MNEIEAVTPDGGDWCSIDKATTLAALIVSLRPTTVVEIGVFLGGSAIPMLLALRAVGAGRLVAIDPWSTDAALAAENDENAAWWRSIDFESIYDRFHARLVRHGVAGICDVRRAKSDDVDPPVTIDLLHVDGSHTEQAIRDVQRFASRVLFGGFCVLDDLNWQGNGVRRAHALARQMGFVDRYELGTGVVMQRVRG
jgi:predicted O-methyltransferase YrrM